MNIENISKKKSSDPLSSEDFKQYLNKLNAHQPLSDFIMKLNDYTPTIPDAVTTYYLSKSGLESDDPRLIRLISIAAQKFISDLANDALQHNKMRAAATSTGNKNISTQPGKYTLTTEDLSAAASEYGIHIKKPAYYC